MTATQRKTPSRVTSEFEDVIVTAGHMFSVFRKSLPTPKPPFPSEFMETVPSVDIDVFKGENLNANELIETLGLGLQRRLDIVTFLVNDQEYTDKSRNNQLFSAYLCLQSFPALFFVDIQEVEPSCVSTFVQALRIAERYVPETIDLIFRSFYYFYHRLITAENCVSLVPAANEFFALFDEHKIPKYYVPELIDVTVSVLEKRNSAALDVICGHLEVISKELSDQPLHTPENMAVVDKALEIAANIAMEEVEKGDGLSSTAGIAVKFGVELSRLTSRPFPQVAPYFERMVETPKFSEMGSVPWVPEEIEDFSIEGKELSPVDIVVKVSDVTLPDVSDFLALLNEHPITAVVNSLCLISSASQFTMFSHLFEQAIEVVQKGDLNMLGFVLLFVYHQEIKDVYRMASFLNEVKGYSIFFADCLFKVKGSLFDEKVPIIVGLRKFSIDVFAKLFSKLNDEKMFEFFAEGMAKVAENPILFAEFMYLSRDFLKIQRSEAIFKAIAKGFKYIEFALRDPNYPQAQRLAKVALSVLDELFKNPAFVLAVADSPSACEMLILLMGDPCFTEAGEMLFRRAFEMSCQYSERPAFKGLTEASARAIQERKQAAKVFQVVNDILKESNRAYIVEICKSPLFREVQAFIGNAESSDDVSAPLDILKYSVVSDVYREVHLDWTEVAKQIEGATLNEHVYRTLLPILAGNWDRPIGVNNRDAVCLIPSLLRSNHGMEFAKTLLESISSDSVQCLHLFEYDTMSIFVDFLKNFENDSGLYDTVMMIIVRMLSLVCNRTMFNQFFKLFEPHGQYQNPHMQQLCQYLLSAMIDDPNNQQSVFHFRTGSSFVFLPRLPADVVSSGCSFVLRLCLTDLKGQFCLVSMSSADKELMVLLSDGSLRVKSNTLAHELVIPMSYPVNEWFTLTLSFENLGSLKVYVNGVLSGEGVSKTANWSNGVEKLILFRPPSSVTNEQLAEVEGLLGDFWIFKGKISSGCNASVRRNDFESLGKEKALFGWYSPKATHGNRMKNLCSGKRDFALFDLTSIPFMNTFCRLFEKYNGLKYVLSLFEQVPLPAKEDKASILSDLFGLVQFLLGFSPDVQNQMLELHGFKVIASHLSLTDPSMLDILSWKKAMMLPCSITNDALLNAFYRDIILGFKGWLRGPKQVAMKCLKRWHEIATTQRDLFAECVSTTSLLYAAYDKLSLHDVSDKEKERWFGLLDSVSSSFGDVELNILGQLISKSLDKPGICVYFLNLFSDISVEKQDTLRAILCQLVRSVTKVQEVCPVLLTRILSLCEMHAREVLPDLLVSAISEIGNGTEKDASEAVTAFANALMKRSNVSLSDLARITDADDVDEQMLPFFLLFSWSCNQEQKEQVSKLLNNLSRSPAGVFLAERLDSLSLFIACTFVCLVDRSALEFLAGLLSVNIKLISQSFDIVDCIAYATGTNQLEFSQELASSILVHCNSRKTAKEIEQLIDTMVSFVLSQREMHYPDRNGACDLHKVLETMHTYSPSIPRFPGKLSASFSQVALKLLNFLYQNTIPSACRDKLIGVLFLLCDPETNLVSDICPFLNQAAKLYDMSSRVMAPLISQVRDHLSDYSEANVFCSRLASIGERPPVDRQEVVDSFGEWVLPATEFAKEIDSLVHRKPVDVPLETSSSEDPRVLVDKERESFLEQCHVYARAIKSALNPPSEAETKKRWNNVDGCFNPFIFTGMEKKKRSAESLCGDVLWSSPCERVTFTSRKNGILSLTKTDIAFKHEDKLLLLPGEDILCVFWNWHLHKPDSFVIVTKHSQCYLFTLSEVTTQDFIAKLREVSLPNCVYIQDVPPTAALETFGITHKWRKGAISNFEYLMWLNVLSGRTTMDPESYPIFPVLFFTGSDGSRKQRDLTKNIAAVRDGTSESPFDKTYMTANIVRSLLKPLDRDSRAESLSPAAFLSGLGTGDITSELPPEFFGVPELFDGLELPPWCDSAVDFVRQHAQALESPAVTAVLPAWIDLIWGVKQRGDGNTYDQRLYPDVWTHEEIDANEIQQLLATNGQIPQQLFTEPHPSIKERDSQKPVTETLNSVQSKIIRFGVSGSTKKNLKILTAHKNETVQSNSFPNSVTQLEQIDIKWCSHIHFSVHMSIVYSQLSSNSFSFINPKKRGVQRPNESDLQQSSIVEVRASESSAVTAAEDGSIYAWNSDLNVSGKLFVHEAPLTFVDVVDSLHAVVSCDESGKAVLSLLPNLVVVKVLETGVKPRCVVYVKRMGVFVVFGDDRMKSYTVNGTFVCEKELVSEVSCACGLTTCLGIATRDDVVLFDPFRLEPIRSIHKHASRVIGMTYYPPLRRIVMTTEEHQIVLVYVERG